MEKYLTTINKVGEFVHNNSDFCKSLELIFPIPDQTNNNKNLVCWYPASGGDFTLLEQDLYLPIEGKMEEVKTFIYVDKDYFFVKVDESGLYSVIYGHNGTLCAGVLGNYLGFKCVLQILDNKVCIFINSDIRLFEDLLIRNNIKVDLVCFLPYGVPNLERPSRFAELNAQFFLGSLESELEQNFRLEIAQPELNYSMGGGGPHAFPLRRVVPSPIPEMPGLTKQDKIEALRRLANRGEVVMEIPAVALKKLDNRLLEIKNLTLEEALNDLYMQLEKGENTHIIRDVLKSF